jgi:hypothetical protein
VQAHAFLAEFGSEQYEVDHGAAEPVQSGDFEGVAVTEHLHHEVELRAAGFGAAGDIDVDVGGVHADAT